MENVIPAKAGIQNVDRGLDSHLRGNDERLEGFYVKEENIACFKCRHFYITWDKSFPYGCKAMGFKSKEISSALVQQSSGTKCLYFEKKEA